MRTSATDTTLDAVLEAPDAFLADPTQHFKDNRNVTIARIPRSGKTGWVLRRLNYGEPLHQLRDSLRPTRSYRAFNHGLRLEQTVADLARRSKDMMAAPMFSNEDSNSFLPTFCHHREATDWHWWWKETANQM